MTLEKYEEWKKEHWKIYERAREERDAGVAELKLRSEEADQTRDT